MRPRSQSIGKLGRAPGRTPSPTSPTSPTPPTPPSPAPLPAPPPAERGVIRRWLQGAMLDNLGLKFLSMVLAVTVFLLVNTDKDREITARVGVSYVLPEDRVLVSERVEEVRVTLKGAWRRLRKFDEREIDRINLDLRRAPSGEIAVSEDMIHLPSGVTVTSISPRSVRVAFEKRVDKVVEVTPRITGRPQHGYVVAEVKPSPATVKVRGADGLLAALASIRTREISLEGRTDSFTAETAILPPEGVEVSGDASIAVLIRIDEELVTRKLPGMTVVIRGDSDPARWKVTPAQVDVTLTGALLEVEKARASLVPVVKLPPDLRAREVEITMEGLLPGVGVKVSPEHVRLAPLRPGSAEPASPR